MPRKKLPPSERKTASLRASVTPANYARLKRVCASMAISLSSFIVHSVMTRLREEEDRK